MRAALKTLFLGSLVALIVAGGAPSRAPAQAGPVVVEVSLDQMVHHVSAEYIIRGIQHANEVNASAVLLRIDTPGGLQNSMRSIIQAILDSRVPVITYVAPSGSRAASAGFFILLAGDVAVMTPGTTTGAAHPVILGGANFGKTLETKIENDAAAYIRSLADKRQRNSKLAEAGVRESKSYTEKEALEGKLIDAIANTPADLFTKFDGKAVARFNDSSTTLRLAGVTIQPYAMSRREMFFAWLADPNIAFLLGAFGLACLYVEFTHPGLIAPGVVGAIALVLALYAFNLLPINTLGVLLILLAVALFILEANVTSHGALGAAGVVAMVLGAMILVDSPWPEARIRLSTALSVTLPLATISVLLMRLAIKARRAKAVTGREGMIDTLAVAETDLAPEGKVLAQGEIWNARARTPVARGARVRVREVDGLTLVVEPVSESG